MRFSYWVWALRFAALRLSAQWRSLVTTALGILLATIVGASMPLYTSAIAQLGLVQHLQQQAADAVNISVEYRLPTSAPTAQSFDAAWSQTDTTFRSYTTGIFSIWLNTIISWGETQPMFLVRSGQDVPDVRVRLGYYDDPNKSVAVVQGSPPQDVKDSNAAFDVSVGNEIATILDLSVGDEMTLDQRGWESSIPIRVRITAIVDAARPQDTYFMEPSPLRTSGRGNIEPTFLTTRSNFIRATTAYLPEASPQLGWRLLVDYPQLPVSAISGVANTVIAYEAGLEELSRSGELPANTGLQTELPTHLQDYQRQVGLNNAPLGSILLQIGSLVLFFLVTTAALVRRSERSEVAMLQSRGAQDGQIFVWRGFEAALLCILCALVAPLAAQALLVWLTPALSGIPELPIPLTTDAFVYSAGAAFIAFIALMATLRPMLRLPLILSGGTTRRAETQPWWQRYYLDVLFLIIGTGAIWRLISTNSPVIVQGDSDVRSDWLLLIAPTLMFVALGSILLRVFPAIVAFVAHGFAARTGLNSVLAAWQVSREPVHYGRIVFLLALAIGIGWFATSFYATVRRSQADRAQYQIGADVRLQERSATLNSPRARAVDTYTAAEGVQSAGVALRYAQELSTTLTRRLTGEILAIDPSFASVAYWRSDLGALPQPRTVSMPESVGRVLPAQSRALRMWMRLEGDLVIDESGRALWVPLLRLTAMSPSARFRNAQGTFTNRPFEIIQFEGLESGEQLDPVVFTLESFQPPGEDQRRALEYIQRLSGWVLYEVDVSDLGAGVHLESIYWQNNQGFGLAVPELSLLLADMSIIAADGNSMPLDWLNNTDSWDLVRDTGVEITGTINSVSVPDVARSGLRAEWRQSGNNASMGIVLDYPDIGGVPAAISTPVAVANELSVDGQFTLYVNQGYVTFRVESIVNYYPSLYNHFLVADLDTLLYVLNRRPSAAVYASEVWLRLDSGVRWSEVAPILAQDSVSSGYTLSNVQTVDAVINTFQTNLLSVGLLGLMIIGFLVAFILSVFSLLTYTALTTRSRRPDLAVLRALGVSSFELLCSIGIEQILVLITAQLVGIVLGVMISNTVLPTLSTSASGTSIVPPFSIQVEPILLAQYAISIGVVLWLVLLASLLLVRQISITRTLRTGAE
jgi:hypothetical protein